MLTIKFLEIETFAKIRKISSEIRKKRKKVNEKNKYSGNENFCIFAASN